VLRASGDNIICRVNVDILKLSCEMNEQKSQCSFVTQMAKSHSHHELYASGHHNGSEREGVRADGGHHDGRDIGMDHGGSRCGGVGRAARGGGNYYTCTETNHIFTSFPWQLDSCQSKQKKCVYDILTLFSCV